MERPDVFLLLSRKQRLTIKQLVNTREKIIGQAEAWANRLQGTDKDEEQMSRLRAAHSATRRKTRHVCMDRPVHALAETCVVSVFLFHQIIITCIFHFGAMIWFVAARWRGFL